MVTYKKRDLIEFIKHLEEDDEIRFVMLHDAEEGDILQVMGPYDPADSRVHGVFSISLGDPDTVEYGGVDGDPFIDTLVDDNLRPSYGD